MICLIPEIHSLQMSVYLWRNKLIKMSYVWKPWRNCWTVGLSFNVFKKSFEIYNSFTKLSAVFYRQWSIYVNKFGCTIFKDYMTSRKSILVISQLTLFSIFPTSMYPLQTGTVYKQINCSVSNEHFFTEQTTY